MTSVFEEAELSARVANASTEDSAPSRQHEPLDPFGFTDDLGPAKIVHLTERSTGLRATVVIDNVAAGPAIGGVRMAPDVTTAECVGLARAMTLKNAAAGLPHGGGKSVIAADPSLPPVEKERLLRAFAVGIAELHDYIPGPDMGLDEISMAWVHDEIGRAVGLPAELGGIPLDQLGATGFGLAVAIDVAAPECGVDLVGARVAVQGFGSVGRAAARFLAERGCVLVAAADSSGCLIDEGGIDVEALIATTVGEGRVIDHPTGRTAERDAVVGVDCEIWIPAARPDVIRDDNVDQVKARLIAEGANIPITPSAEAHLYERGVLVLPDFIANAGGVICGSVEYAGGTRAHAFAAIEEKIRTNTATVLAAAVREGVSPRTAALVMAEQRVRRAMAGRRFC